MTNQEAGIIAAAKALAAQANDGMPPDMQFSWESFRPHAITAIAAYLNEMEKE